LEIKIKNRRIGDNNPAFIVAEAGINHNGNVKIAKKLIDEAKEAGADAIKFQTFKAIDLAVPGSAFFKTFKKVELDSTDFKEISDHAKARGIIFFSTPFSENAVNLLTKMHVPCFKISSGDLIHIPLLKYVAKKKKPIVISTGMANLKEVEKAVNTIESENNKKIIIMHSISSYPTPANDVCLKAIHTLKQKFPYPIGFSDNGGGIEIPSLSVALGAKIVEKHFTLNKKMKGPDQFFSANPKELKLLVKQIKKIEMLIGDGKKEPKPSEHKNLVLARRSITSNISISKGEKIHLNMIVIRRPAKGIKPENLKKVLNKRAKKNISAYKPITWNDLE